MPPDELLQEFEIDATPIWPAEDDRIEPIFLVGPLAAELEEFAQLDPERNAPEPDDPPPPPRRPAATLSLCGSLGLHLLPLLVLIHWNSAPAEIADAMPVQLVLEEPPSGPSQAEGKPTPSPPVQSETISEKSAAAGAPDAPAAPPTSPPQKQLAAIPPVPSPPPPEPPPHKPATITVAAAAPPTPAAPSAAATPTLAEAQAPGLDPLQSDYFARLAALTRDHLDLLPLSFLGGRRGRTVLAIYVLGDGTIGRIAVKQSSGYSDIDTRIEQIVTAVGRFPPLPERLGKPNLELDLNLIFPDALKQ